MEALPANGNPPLRWRLSLFTALRSVKPRHPRRSLGTYGEIVFLVPYTTVFLLYSAIRRAVTNGIYSCSDHYVKLDRLFFTVIYQTDVIHTNEGEA